MNLVVNARDAMPSGGTLRIEVRNVDLDGTAGRSWPVDVPAGPYVLLSVSDTGEGMDAETQARVFEPFFTTKADGKGTGLGLATVFGIVKQSKGFVWVYSEPGGGTTFKVYLPAVNEPVAEESTVLSVASANGGGETILVAEDDPGLLEITREVLENSGYTVLPASGGDEALRIATEHTGPIALLLSDLVMGGVGGHALAKRLGQSRPQTRVLFMSGYTADSLHQQGGPEEASADPREAVPRGGPPSSGPRGARCSRSRTQAFVAPDADSWASSAALPSSGRALGHSSCLLMPQCSARDSARPGGSASPPWQRIGLAGVAESIATAEGDARLVGRFPSVVSLLLGSPKDRTRLL